MEILDSDNVRGDRQDASVEKGVRLERIFKIMDTAPRVSTFEDAKNLLEDAFTEVEQPLVDSGAIPRALLTESPRGIQTVTLHGRSVHFTSLIRHILFYGEKGAIRIYRKAVQRTDKEIEEVEVTAADVQDRPELVDNLLVVFDKPGADNLLLDGKLAGK